MILNKLVYSGFLISILILGCSRVKIEKDGTVKIKEVSNNEGAFIEVILNNDSINSDTLKGNIKYYFKVNDSLKILSEDERRIFLAVGVKPDNDLEFKKNKDDFFTKDIRQQLNKSNDTMIIPFSLSKQFRGNVVIFGVIGDTFVLKHPDYTDSPEIVRMLSFDHTFETSVYLE